MKTLMNLISMVASATLLSSTSFGGPSVTAGAGPGMFSKAKPKCEVTCKSTPKAGDIEFVANAFDSISICESAAGITLEFTKDGKSESVDAEPTRRVGSVSYLVQSDDVDATLEVASGIAGKVLPAKLKVTYKKLNETGSSTCTCTR